MANLSINETKLLDKLRNVDNYENMSRQQLKSILATMSTPKPTLKANQKPKSTDKAKKKSTSKAKGKSEHKPKSFTAEPS